MDAAGDGVRRGCGGGNNPSNRHLQRHHYISGVALKRMLLIMVIIGITSLLHQSAYPTKLYQISYLFSGHLKNRNGGNLYSLLSYDDDNHAAKKHNVSSSFHQFTTQNSPLVSCYDQRNYK